jgi:hypothetical protein
VIRNQLRENKSRLPLEMVRSAFVETERHLGMVPSHPRHPGPTCAAGKPLPIASRKVAVKSDFRNAVRRAAHARRLGAVDGQ